LDKSKEAQIQQRIDTKTKPIGALGQLETVAQQLCLIQGHQSGNYQHIEINQPPMPVKV
jgi:nicotinate-nucleotide--dimethylbenzimidazole phosphoribosyltransferase